MTDISCFISGYPTLSEEEILLELPEDQRTCGKCGGMFRPIGKKFVRHELQIIPRQTKLLAYYTMTYACDHYEKETGFAHIAYVKPPVPLIKHSLASPSSVADIMEKKCADFNNKLRKEYRQNFVRPVLEEYCC